LVPETNWVDKADLILTAVDAYTWSGELNHYLYSRGSEKHITGVQFVLKITYPDGQVNYDRGSLTPRGYYQTGEWSTKPEACNPWGEKRCDLDIELIDQE
jgi:hypothetical protein